MTGQPLTTLGDYNNAPIKAVIIDEDGTAWQKVANGDKGGLWKSAYYDGNVRVSGMVLGTMHYCTLVHPPLAEHQEHPNKRTIHTAEELQQLPEGTVIIGHNGWVWENMSGLWHTTGSLPPMDHGAHIFTFHARVIYMPEEGDHQ